MSFSEVDIRHAEEGLTVIRDYVDFHQISDGMFSQIARLTIGDHVFGRHYFPLRSKQRARTKAAPAQAKRIESVTIYQSGIPFHQVFRHALHSREESDAVVVKVTDSEGRSGFGESLPRSYVTGETTDTMIARIRDRLAPEIFRDTFAPGWETIEYLQSAMLDWTRNDDRNTPIVAWNAAFAPWS